MHVCSQRPVSNTHTRTRRHPQKTRPMTQMRSARCPYARLRARPGLGKQTGLCDFLSPARKRREPPRAGRPPPGSSNFALCPLARGRTAGRAAGSQENARLWAQSADREAAGKGSLAGAEGARSSGAVGRALPDLWPSLDLWASQFLRGEDASGFPGFPGVDNHLRRTGGRPVPLEGSVSHTSAHLPPWRMQGHRAGLY